MEPFGVIQRAGRWSWQVGVLTGGHTWLPEDSWWCLTEGAARRSVRRWIRRQARIAAHTSEPMIVRESGSGHE